MKEIIKTFMDQYEEYCKEKGGSTKECEEIFGYIYEEITREAQESDAPLKLQYPLVYDMYPSAPGMECSRDELDPDTARNLLVILKKSLISSSRDKKYFDEKEELEKELEETLADLEFVYPNIFLFLNKGMGSHNDYRVSDEQNLRLLLDKMEEKLKLRD